mgnify:CR=1 FL=1
MRVRISYSVDLDDVPNECARMLNDSLKMLNKVHEEIESLIHQLDNGSAVDWQVEHKLSRCRTSLAKIDMVLEDNGMILEGFYSSKNPKEEEDVSSEG